MAVKKITSIGLMTAFLCITAPWAIHIGPVPITLATFGLYLVSAVLGEKYATVSVVIYLILGAVGVPVFSGFSGGIQRLVGMTGGYLLGYVPCVFVIGLIISKTKKHFIWYLVAMLIGTVILYSIGTAWYIWQTGNTFFAALGLCVVPFLPGDIIKIVAASVLGFELNKRLKL
ncbi:MAG: biotin transporter BioY [Lachnospiraceae bacterium]|nr:biotin transporter BioY [Lachnospiraceae bacterium]